MSVRTVYSVHINLAHRRIRITPSIMPVMALSAKCIFLIVADVAEQSTAAIQIGTFFLNPPPTAVDAKSRWGPTRHQGLLAWLPCVGPQNVLLSLVASIERRGLQRGLFV